MTLQERLTLLAQAIGADMKGKAPSVHAHANATPSEAGFMSAPDKTKLDGVLDPWKAITGGIRYNAGHATVVLPDVTAQTPAFGGPDAFYSSVKLKLDVAGYVASAQAGHFVATNESTAAGASGASGEVGITRGVYAEAVHNTAFYANDCYAATAFVTTTPASTGVLRFAYGAHGGLFHYGAGNVKVAYNSFSETYHAGTGDVEVAFGYYGDASAVSTGKILKHVTLANKDLSSDALGASKHAQAQYGAILFGRSRFGNSYQDPVHVVEVAGDMDISPNYAFTPPIPAVLKLNAIPALQYNTATSELEINPTSGFAGIKANFLYTNRLTIRGDYGGYTLANYSPYKAGLVQVSTGGDGTQMDWADPRALVGMPAELPTAADQVPVSNAEGGTNWVNLASIVPSITVSATAPTNPKIGDLWVDTST